MENNKIGLGQLEFFHKTMIYPTVRVRTAKAGGSGLLVYSAKPQEAYIDEELNIEVGSNEYESYIITCHHVISDAITYEDEWSSIAQRDVKREHRATVNAEVFTYKRLSRVIGGNKLEADIVAWDKNNDIALLKLRSITPMTYVAKLYPKKKHEDIKIGTPLSAVGCSLGHSPIWCDGHLTAKHDEIKNKEYWLTNASTIFGNSGGAVFIKATGEYIGMSAMISAIQLGFGVDIISFMGFFVPINRIYKFIDKEMFNFIYDPSVTSKQCAERREAKRKEEEAKIIVPQKKASIDLTASPGYPHS